MPAAFAARTPPSRPPVPASKPHVPAGPTHSAPPPAAGVSPEPTPGVAAPPVPEKRPEPSSREKSPAPEKAPEAGGGAKRKEAPAGSENREQEQEPEPVPVPGVAEDGEELAACYKALDSLGVAYAKKGTINDAGRCGIEAPVTVSGILPGVSLEPDGTMRCETALALAKWTKRVVVPSAEALGKGVRLTGLSQGSAYVCRHRDGDPERKISQHAFGNAVDIVTFRFDGHEPLSIAPRERTGRIDEGFQRAVIGGACLYFTTVLGPRADAFHQDNLHLDIDARSHGFRLCQ